MDLLTVVSVMRNERTLIEYFLRWYGSIADKIVIYDGGSDDGTREIAKAHPKVELREYPFGDELCDQKFVDLTNTEYKNFRGKTHWLAWVDSDEFLYHPDLIGILKAYRRKGVTIPHVQGYTMLSRTLPTTQGQIFSELQMGIPDGVYSKPCCINPQIEIAYHPGKHWASVGGWLVKPGDVGMQEELKLLHYRCLGLEYLKARRKRNFSRASKDNLAKGHGFTDFDSYTEGHHSVKWFEEQLECAANVVHPIDHNAVQGWFDYSWFYSMCVNQMKPGDQIVEVGSWMGASTIYLANEVIKSGKAISVHAVDTWDFGTDGDPTHKQRIEALQSDMFSEFMDNITQAGVKRIINPIRLPSVEAAKQFSDGSLAVVFLDAGHSFEAVRDDIQAWLPRIRSGGILSGHDYSESTFPGVVKAIQALKNHEKRGLQVQNTVWWIRKG